MNQTEQMREALREAMGWNWLDGDVPDSVVKKCEQALAHVNETLKNEHDSADVLKPAKLVRLADDILLDIHRKATETWLAQDCSPRIGIIFGSAIMDAMEELNK